MSAPVMPYILGNWKMNLDVESAMTLAQAIAPVADEAEGVVGVGIAPPALWIPTIAAECADSNLLIGAQDCAAHPEGAFTGDISAAMLAPWCAFTIVGHSERRQHHGETDDVIAAKLRLAIEADMAVVLCVGETESERATGDAFDVVARQLTSATADLDAGKLQSLLVAWEPVWAIGTGNNADAGDAQEMASHIRGLLSAIDAGAAASIPILYGGSVNPSNAAGFFAQPDVNGALVGGASLVADDFVAIIDAAGESA